MIDLLIKQLCLVPPFLGHNTFINRDKGKMSGFGWCKTQLKNPQIDIIREVRNAKEDTGSPK